MGDKGLDFKHKEVININNGKRLGYVQDVCADLETGMITSIIVPGSNKIMSFFNQNNDIVIPWQNIKCIGDDLILVEIYIFIVKIICFSYDLHYIKCKLYFIHF